MCGIFGRKTESANAKTNFKCPFCAEYIRPEAIKCKHCHSDLSPLPSHEALVNLLAQFEQYNFLSFLNENHALIEAEVAKFAQLGNSYLEAVKRTGDNEDVAEKRLLKKINELASMQNQETSEQFKELCLKYSPWLVMA
ncbi:TPA: hypothetical protein ACXE9F_001456 [Pluralibacter gergoviae]